MRIDRDRFLASVRARFGALRQSQADGFTSFLGGLEQEAALPITHAAYMMATAWHETARTMQPVRETLASSDLGAITALDRDYTRKTGKPAYRETHYWTPDATGRSWFGRGYVQITHRENYQKLGDAIGMNLTSRPELALLPSVAFQILAAGMRGGLFTGRKLGDYLTATKTDYRGARNVVNRTDRARTIASYAEQFETALIASQVHDG